MDVKNCQRFIEAHPDIKQGGCSEKPHLTSNDSNKIPERKINRKKTTPIEYPVQQSVKKTITVPEGYPLKEYFFNRVFGWLKRNFIQIFRVMPD